MKLLKLSALLFVMGCSNNATNTANLPDVAHDGSNNVSDTGEDVMADVARDMETLSNYREVVCADHLSVPADGMRCGFIAVPQNRVRETGRDIELFVVRPENAPTDKPPVVVLAGGPGAPHADFAARQNLPIDVTAMLGREAIYYEQRGLAPSIPSTFCDGVEGGTVGSAIRAFGICKTSWEADNVDVYSYHTLENAADIAAIPAALGIEKIDVFAGSYATQLMARVLERHPESIRVAVLGGVDVSGGLRMEPGTAEYGMLLEDAATAYGAQCATVPACDAFLPGFDFTTIVTDLAALIVRDGSVSVAGIPIQSLQQLQGLLFPMMYIAQIRNMMFAAMYHASTESTDVFNDHVGEGDAVAGAAFVSALLQQAQASVFGGDSTMAVVTRCFDGEQSNCDLIGDYPADYPPSEFLDNVGSDHPILFFSGSFDPATPTVNMDGYLPLFPNASWSVFGCLGHDVSRISNVANGMCLVDQAKSFLDDPSAPLPDCNDQLCEDLPLIPDRTQLTFVVDQYVAGFDP